MTLLQRTIAARWRDPSQMIILAFALTSVLPKEVVGAGLEDLWKSRGSSGVTVPSAGSSSSSISVYGSTQPSHPLLEGCEMPTHSSINLQQGRWPWSVQVFASRHSDAFSMASNLGVARVVEGTLISRRHVLTTSIDIGANWEKLKIRFRTDDAIDIEVDVKKRIYFNSSGNLGDNNIAILELAELVRAPKFPDGVRPLCILSPGVVSNRTNAELVSALPTISAFTNSHTNHLCQMSVKFIPDDQCEQEFESLTGTRSSFPSYICDDLDKCNDLVGSMVMVQENDQRFHIVGLLSFVYNHYAPESSYPSLFQRILPEHIAWIESVVHNLH